MEYNEYNAQIDTQGVHWFWWLFWLIFAAPVLLIVLVVHLNKKNRAISFYQGRLCSKENCCEKKTKETETT